MRTPSVEKDPWHQAGHLPIEQVSKFTFMIKAAKALGMTVPPALLSRRRR